MTTRASEGSGAVVLAAFRPDPDLFRVQLESIRDQTRPDFVCLVGADGGVEDVARLVAEVVGGDERFRVVGWDDNRGFYLNFERLLAEVPDDAAWVALSDQDDRWHLDKLERLVPLLDDAVLATGQARVVSHPDQRVLLERTDRRVVAPRDLLVQNQVTGGQTVLRRGLLDVALPFPRWRTATQLHDHWLALCATAADRYVVLDEVVQDYVQHDGNLVGEVARRHPRTPWGAAALVRSLADEYEGGHSPRQVLAAAHAAGIGWRRLVARELGERLPDSAVARDLDRMLGAPGAARTLRATVAALRSGDVTTGTALTLAAGIPGELVASRHRGRATSGQAGTDPRRAVMITDAAPQATCWLCGATATDDTPYASVGYARCTTCGFLFQPHRASAEEEAGMYDAEYFDGYDQRTGGRAGGDAHYDLATTQRESEARLRVEFVRSLTGPPGTLLEVGAASGYFVAAAARAGFDAVGIEPSSATAADARARAIPVRTGTLADVAAEGEQFDVVCAWHVLEHLPQPRSAILEVRSVLRPGGWLFLELPNVGSVAAQRGGAGWAHLDPEAHVAHYTPGHLATLLEGTGLEVHALESFSVRAFGRSRWRRLGHAAYDAAVLRTPGATHPTRHELMRVAARRPRGG